MSTAPITAALSATDVPAPVSLREAFWVWLRIAALSFGGPAAQIAVMHRILVDEKRWIGEHRFLHALNYCMLLPGPEAQQLATYIGWLMHKKRGGLVAGGLFVLPGAIAIMALSWIYALYGHVGIVAGLFFGLKCAVLAVVLQAVIRIGSRSLKNTSAGNVAMRLKLFSSRPMRSARERSACVAACSSSGSAMARSGATTTMRSASVMPCSMQDLRHILVRRFGAQPWCKGAPAAAPSRALHRVQPAGVAVRAPGFTLGA